MTQTAITEAWQENKQYELVPDDDGTNEWKVRILVGDFIESVVKYGHISFNDKDFTMAFDYSLEYSPDTSLTAEDTDLKTVVSHILHSILVNAFDNQP